MTAALHIEDLQVSLGGDRVLDGASLNVTEGEIVALLGPSGCGKTTLLRVVAGLQDSDGGSVHIFGQSGNARQFPPERRQVGMVFQDLALFPHCTVAKNVGFGLRTWSRAHRAQRVEELLQRMGLKDLGQRYPHELSGGQQQRVALARSLAPKPRLLLLDEPFASLDTPLRQRLAPQVAQWVREEQVTCVVVTHDHAEAAAMADRVLRMEAGKVV